MKLEILQGDCLEVLKTLPDESVNCCVTSPPYWGLRDYGCAGQLGLERMPELYVAKMVEVLMSGLNTAQGVRQRGSIGKQKNFWRAQMEDIKRPGRGEGLVGKREAGL